MSNPRNALFFILLLIPFTVGAQLKTSAVSPVFSLHLETAKRAPDFGGHFRIGVTLTNESDHKIRLEHDIGHKGDFYYIVMARREDNSEPNKSEYHRALRGERTANPILIQGSSIEVALEPGKRVVDVIDLSELYDLNLPGKYTFQVQRTDQYSKTVVKSNVITVTVPR
jgi:hypothetical protein